LAEDVHAAHSERLKQHGQRRLASRKTSVQESDTRDDDPYQVGHDHHVDVVELKSLVLGIDIFKIRIPAIGLRVVELGLCDCQFEFQRTIFGTYGRWSLHVDKFLKVMILE
jgi:hypothetical protein